MEGPALYFLDPSATDGLAHSMAYAVTSVPIDDIHTIQGLADADEDDAVASTRSGPRLPPTVPARVLDLGRSLVAPTADPTDAVLAVEDFVRHRARYTLDSPVPGRGEDAVDDFLFNSHLGFCEHFASAEVVLLEGRGDPRPGRHRLLRRDRQR